MNSYTENTKPNSPRDAIEAFRVAVANGDTLAIKAAHIDGDVFILDNVRPFVWSGVSGVEDWLASMAVYAQEHGITDSSVIYDDPITELDSGDQAYAVLPALWTYKSNGAPRRDIATIAFALRRSENGWKVEAWSWNPSK